MKTAEETVELPKAAKKAARGPRRAHAAPAKARAGKTAQTAKSAAGARNGSKTAKILDMLKRPGGVTAEELLKFTEWMPHSLRGFLSGTVGKKMGLAVTSSKGDDGARTYSVKV